MSLTMSMSMSMSRSLTTLWRRVAMVMAVPVAIPLALLAAVHCAAASAQQEPPPAAQAAPRVTISSTRDPVDKSYRKMISGMDRFEREHALAPNASLRFELLPRLPTTELDGITLRVAGDSVSLPVAVAADHTFTLPRNRQAWDEDAALLASRKTSTLTWRAQVRSPGVPAGMRRLGDLRLECLVGMEAGLVSNNSQLFAWLGDLLNSPDKVCSTPDGNYLFFAERPLFGVTLQAGARTQQLPYAALYAGGTQTPATLPFCDCQVLLDRSYYAPIWDRGDGGWPDDTLLVFDYMDDPPGAGDTALAEGYRNTQDMRARLGPAAEVHFDSGYQVWRYAVPAAAKDGTTPRVDANGKPPTAEFIILFGPDGMARKARLHEPP